MITLQARPAIAPPAANDPTRDHALRSCLQRCAFLLDTLSLGLPVSDTAREAAGEHAAEARRLLVATAGAAR